MTPALHARFKPVWPRGCWPDHAQQLLLQACLLENPQRAQAAFQAWTKAVDLFFVDAGSHMLLLMLYERLRDWAVEYPEMERLKGIARYFWVRHQAYRRDLRELAAMFAGGGIEIMLLKGAALNATVYRDGNRLMSDIDIAVRRADAHKAGALLQAHGWEPQFRNVDMLSSVTHGCHYKRGDSHLDLHWDFFHGRPLDAEGQELLWSDARTIDIDGAAVRSLCATDEFLHTCEHGLRVNETPPFRWLADALLIFRHGGMDWGRLAKLAERFQLIDPVRQTLQYLETCLDAPVPGEAYAELGARRRSLAAGVEFFVTTRRGPGAHPFWTGLPGHLFAFARARRAVPGLSLGRYLTVVNDFAPPLWSNMRSLIALEVAARGRAIQRFLARLGEGLRGRRGDIHIEPYAADAWHGFYPPEWTRFGVLRWSGANSAVHLPVRNEHRRIILRLAHIRRWDDDLRRTLALRFNRHPIPSKAIRFKDGAIVFDIEPAMLARNLYQRLEIQCSRWPAAPGDTRHLGLPLLRVSLLTRVT